MQMKVNLFLWWFEIGTLNVDADLHVVDLKWGHLAYCPRMHLFSETCESCYMHDIKLSFRCYIEFQKHDTFKYTVNHAEYIHVCPFSLFRIVIRMKFPLQESMYMYFTFQKKCFKHVKPTSKMKFIYENSNLHVRTTMCAVILYLYRRSEIVDNLTMLLPVYWFSITLMWWNISATR